MKSTVLDFGLAKAADSAGGVRKELLNSPTITSPAITAAGVILGTAAYMSPEQARASAASRRRSALLIVAAAIAAVIATVWAMRATDASTSPPQRRFALATPNDAPPLLTSISADGSAILVIAADKLWLQRLDGFAASEVPGCEGEANGGVFLWGIGNSVAPGLSHLVAQDPFPEVLFSPIQSRTRPEDAHPDELLIWTRATGLDGAGYEIPLKSLVISRGGGARAKTTHYALVCYSSQPLRLDGRGVINPRRLRNLMTGRPLGSSQVTAVVTSEGDGHTDGYPVAMRRHLVPPYFLRLAGPKPLTADKNSQTWGSAVVTVWQQLLVRTA